MTSEGLAEGVGAPVEAALGARAGSGVALGARSGAAPGEHAEVSRLLDLCDGILGEMGRRRHLFAWLRPPELDDGWLAVDAYYPASRLVVVCQSTPGAHDDLYR